MSAFLTKLVCECIDDLSNDGRGTWKVMEPFCYQSDVLKGRVITIEQGFETDFASVPRIPFAYWFFGDTAHESAVIHDWLFHHHEVCDEPTANSVLMEAMTVEGIPAWRRWGIYMGVKIGGYSPWVNDGASTGDSP